MKIAISGKGGSGKTTISATLARLFARRGFPVLAIDGDPNPNLAQALGIKDSLNFEPIPRTIVERREDESGATRMVLTKPVTQIIDQHGIKAPDGVTLVVGSRVDHAGAG
jgi:CO dehydrogenase maturation factor